MLTPQEINVWYVLPALRRELTLVLKKRKIKQKDIAKILGITEPAVSQYLKNKRAKALDFPKDVKKAIGTAADNLTKDKSCHRFEIQNLLDLIRTSGFLCKVHRKNDDVPECCNVCMGDKKCVST